MRKLCSLVVVTTVSILASSSFPSSKPKVSKSPLSEDQNQVYLAFFHSYVKGNSYANLVIRTSPLILSGFMDSCLKDMQLENLADAKQTVHTIGTEVTAHFRIKLVDPRHFKISDPEDALRKGKITKQAVQDGFEAGLLSISEIAFDRNHQRAVMKYSFYCGSLCGNGATLIYEKTGDGWTESKGTKCVEQFIS